MQPRREWVRCSTDVEPGWSHERRSFLLLSCRTVLATCPVRSVCSWNDRGGLDLLLEDWSLLAESMTENLAKIGLQHGIPMPLVSTTVMVPELLEVLNSHLSRSLLVPGLRSMTPIAPQLHEVLYAFEGLGIEETISVTPVINLNPSVEISRPERGSGKHTMSIVCPIVAVT